MSILTIPATHLEPFEEKSEFSSTCRSLCIDMNRHNFVRHFVGGIWLCLIITAWVLLGVERRESNPTDLKKKNVRFGFGGDVEKVGVLLEILLMQWQFPGELHFCCLMMTLKQQRAWLLWLFESWLILYFFLSLAECLAPWFATKTREDCFEYTKYNLLL